MIRNPKAQTAGMTQLHFLGFIIHAIITATAPLTDLSHTGASGRRQLKKPPSPTGHP
jgi:hypothetical protein